MIKFKLKNIKDKNMYVSFIEYFIMDSIYNNFLKTINCLKNLNEVYETEFNLGESGSN